MIFGHENHIYTIGGTPVGFNEYNPLGLPPYTMRFQFDDESYVPSSTPEVGTSQWVRVSSSPNVWDYTKLTECDNWQQEFYFKLLNTNSHVLGANMEGVVNIALMFYGAQNVQSIQLFDTSSCVLMYSAFSGTKIKVCPRFDTSKSEDLSYFLSGCSELVEAPDFNTSNCTVFTGMFRNCTSLLLAPTLDTSKATQMYFMFLGCTSLQKVPLLRTDNCFAVSRAFEDCVNVTEGAYALYQQMSTQEVPVSAHTSTFKNCGSNTLSGSAELALIPYDWKN